MMKKIIGLILLLVLTSCAGNRSYQLYTGEQKPASEVATIKAWYESRFSPLGGLIVYPMVVDGKKTEEQPRDDVMPSYYVISGEHKVTSILFWNIGFNMVKMIDPKELVFNAKAGHSYLTKAYTPKEMTEKVVVAFWIEDEKTGEVVAGTRPKASE